MQLPIYAWRYNSQPGSVRHMGPMSQDFYSAFGLGEDDRYINSVDADGVASASVQALAVQVQQQSDQLVRLEAQLGSSSAMLTRLGDILGAFIFGGLLGWWLSTRISKCPDATGR